MRYIGLILFTVISVVILRINFKLHSENFSKLEQKEDVILQLNFLEKELKENELGVRMQQLFPEGNVFVNALYGLTWCEVAVSDPTNHALKQRALEESLFAYNNINSDFAKSSFSRDMIPEYGIFYTGWRNYLMSKILSMDTCFDGNKQYIQQFKEDNGQILNALIDSESPYLQSYVSQSWPADMFVAIASLSNHDKIFKPVYQSAINRWVEATKNRLDSNTKLIPHIVNSKSGEPIAGARGSSIALILRMLGEIDIDFGRQQFTQMNEHFLDETFGLPSTREYPKGVDGEGDVDSGPVIFGVGFSGTIVSIGAFSMYDTTGLANQQYKTIHAFGFDRKNELEKKYIFGQLPMADAFIAWGRASSLNYGQTTSIKATFWALKFHLISLFVLLMFWMFFFRRRIFQFVKTRRTLS